MLEAFFLWIYTPRAHADGMVEQIIEEALAFPHPQSTEVFQRQLDPLMTHETLDRLSEIAVPTLVLAGELDIVAPPRLGRVVAQGIPGAEFKVLPVEAHQPFQEVPVQRPGRRLLARYREATLSRPRTRHRNCSATGPVAYCRGVSEAPSSGDQQICAAEIIAALSLATDLSIGFDSSTGCAARSSPRAWPSASAWTVRPSRRPTTRACCNTSAAQLTST